eukprot:CAMPEP_0203938726 /NCGR_PEP_ID=MMETSP0359-20131031/75680_1 /ASSEMBLY_ACC=CAM_ASM_000338 /TAXON_ID=268821 /ORGANISM="Scrippsiella Hangoei, Strain SHTV-5" /LENGTH=48 /DNA_ID= /DNA_START= /DNA_END= /DNA_ORIENTATION=
MTTSIGRGHEQPRKPTATDVAWRRRGAHAMLTNMAPSCSAPCFADPSA